MNKIAQSSCGGFIMVRFWYFYLLILTVTVNGCAAGLPGPTSTWPSTMSNGYRANEAGQYAFFSGWKGPVYFTWSGASDPDTGLISGQGVLETHSGYDGMLLQRYEGEMKNGRYDGRGRLTSFYRDGTFSEYEGPWVRDLKGTGRGRMVYTNGDVYEGEFKNGYRHGRGVYHWRESGNKYEGEWRDHKKNGRGVHYNYGELACNPYYRYEGELKDDLLHGQGIQYDREGRVIRQGLWFEGCPYCGNLDEWQKKDRLVRQKSGRKNYELLDRIDTLSFTFQIASVEGLMVILPDHSWNAVIEDAQGRRYQGTEDIFHDDEGRAYSRASLKIERPAQGEIFTVTFLLYGEPLMFRFKIFEAGILQVE
ncbi:hypothetical protein C4J81_07355 [Deltaproteobacteria bacterium Smac51]|nr:hypothetical protein C4J81_07355 [Deltaproteobacteria bacterium Smac51]